ncbi:MAG: class I SAM-dependent methyltransferase [Planctomycetota bacterium]|jgi:SAM-dependent methyltransferase|nr:class I SAM-dependent methyltransferase [Planctomycetota bacterium]MDP6941890.1 class I SAM-dependent methyltransferase [Planctomycetota bacterium]
MNPSTPLTDEPAPRDQEGNPLFQNPEAYLELRQKSGFLGAMKVWSERRALFSCLDKLSGVKTMLDIPCGPGRAFPYYHERGFHVVGIDFSPQMSGAATAFRGKLGIPGIVCRGDAFRLPFEDNAMDTVVSVRFSYYFDRQKRIELYKELSRVSKQGFVVQVKIDYSLHSISRKLRGKNKNKDKFMQSKREIHEEFAAAGLKVRRIAPLSLLGSDRAFVLVSLN